MTGIFLFLLQGALFGAVVHVVIHLFKQKEK